MVKHPIYSAYLHLGLIFTILNLNLKNSLLFILFFITLYLRSNREEDLQMESDENYKKYSNNKNKFFSIFVSIPILIFLIIYFYEKNNTYETMQSKQNLVVQFGFPAISVDPRYSDDWSSVFIVNHIYPRFFSEKNRDWDYAISKDFMMVCSDDEVGLNIKNCKNIQIKFNLNEFKDCNENLISKNILKNELHEILQLKTWILPNFKNCYDKKYDVCYQGKNVDDLQRRLNNLYFRFGWTYNKPGQLVGAGPYCLKIESEKNGSIFLGELLPKENHKMSKINFVTSSLASDTSNFFLYGDPSLVSKGQKIIPAQTPVAYYMVSNKKWALYKAPWETVEFKKSLSDYLVGKNLIYNSQGAKIMNKFFSDETYNKSIVISKSKNFPPTQKATISIPDYFPDCNLLKETLHKIVDSEYPNISIECTNTSELTDRIVRNKTNNWDAFLSPLSPGAPGRDSIKYQYFSKDSLSSWTGKFDPPEQLYYLVGIGQSWVIIDNKKICGLKPNPLGQGDILITDFNMCN